MLWLPIWQIIKFLFNYSWITNDDITTLSTSSSVNGRNENSMKSLYHRSFSVTSQSQLNQLSENEAPIIGAWIFRSRALNNKNNVIGWRSNKCVELIDYLELRWATFVPDEQKVTLTVDHDLFLEPATLGALLLHVGASEVPVDQGRLARGQWAHDAQPDVGNAPWQRPFLTVDKRIWNGTEKNGNYVSLKIRGTRCRNEVAKKYWGWFYSFRRRKWWRNFLVA